MSQFVAVAASLALLGVACTSSKAVPQSPPAAEVSVATLTPPTDEVALDAWLDERVHAIRSEIESLWPAHPWAAVYVRGGGDTSDAIAVAPDLGFTHQWRDWKARTHVLSYGTVHVTGDSLDLVPLYVATGTRGVSGRFVPVRWGSRRYLIRPDRLTDFCNRVNSGREEFGPSYSMLACRRPDALIASGQPALPLPYREFVFSTPLTGTIIESDVENGCGKRPMRQGL